MKILILVFDIFWNFFFILLVIRLLFISFYVNIYDYVSFSICIVEEENVLVVIILWTENKFSIMYDLK